MAGSTGSTPAPFRLWSHRLISVLWLLGWRAWPAVWPSSANFFITAFILLMVLHWTRLYAAANRIGADRRDGILELLLTTPLSPQQIVEGEVAALTAAFKPMQRIVAELFVLIMMGGFMMRSWNVRAAITYALIWSALCFLCLRNRKRGILKVMWVAVNTGRPVYSVFRWHGNKWSWIWLLYNLRSLMSHGISRGRGTFPSGSTLEFTFVCIFAVVIVAAYCAGYIAPLDFEYDMRKRLTMDMRLIAAEPLLDPHDRAFKNWDGIRRLYYHASSPQTLQLWPAFVDQGETERSPVDGTLAPNTVIPRDALHLLKILRERRIDFWVVGDQAMSAYLRDRNTRHAAVLMSATALKAVPELQVLEGSAIFASARFLSIHVVVYFTADPIFEAVRFQFAATVQIAGTEVPSVNVEGMIVLHLYALHMLARQRDYYRQGRYEQEIIALLARYQSPVEAILPLLRTHTGERHHRELENDLERCSERAALLRGPETV